MTDILRAVRLPRPTLFLALLLVLGATACAQTFTAGAALVNGVSIPTEAVERQVDAGGAQGGAGGELTGEARLTRARDVLVALIQGELIRQEAEDRDIAISEEDIDAQIAQIQGSQSDEEFADRVEQAGFTAESLRQQIAIQVAADAIRAELEPAVSESEVREVYQLSRQQFLQAEIKHILFVVDEGNTEAAAERKAQQALVEIRSGESSFESIARDRSDDTQSAKRGGRLPGWTNLNALDPSFAQAASEATVGEVTEPVRSQFGWHLILIEDRRFQPFEEVRGQLEAQLQQQASDSAFQDFLLELLDGADVEVNPRYGDWDPETGTIVPHSTFTAPEPETDPLAPPDDVLPPGFGG